MDFNPAVSAAAMPSPIIARAIKRGRRSVDTANNIPFPVLRSIPIKNGLSKAYLSSKAGPGGAWAGEGETFQGWRVKSVRSARDNDRQNYHPR